MALDLKMLIYTDDESENMYFVDETGLYNASSNPGGFGAPNPASSTVTSFTINLEYTQLSLTLNYVFTVSSNTITAATLAINGGSTTNILAELSSTTFPFTDSNPFNLTGNYGVTLPDFDDMVYSAEYEISGDSGGAYTYSADDTVLKSTDTCCCVRKYMTNIDINNQDGLVKGLIPLGYLKAAGYEEANGNIDEANDYLNRAKAICENSSCDCGC